MRRGELWRSPSSLRDRVILLVSSQTLIDQGVTMLYDAEDPGPLLLVVLVGGPGGEQRWLNVQRGLTRVARRTVTQSYGLADPPVLGQVDALLRVAMDL